MIRNKLDAKFKKYACASLAAVMMATTVLPAAASPAFAAESDPQTPAVIESTLSEDDTANKTDANTADSTNDDQLNNTNSNATVPGEELSAENENCASAGKTPVNDTVLPATGSASAVNKLTSPAPQADEVIYPTRFSLNKTEITLVQGDEFQLKADGFSANATNKDLIWTSSDDDVAKVDENGNVTAVSEGSATITATCVGKNDDEENYASASCTVKVLGIESNFTYSTSEDNEIVIEGYINGNGVLARHIVPEEIDGKPVTAIADNAFADNDRISKLVLPDTIKSVGENSFGDFKIYAKNNTATAETLDNAEIDYLSIVTVTTNIEYYNRDGSLNEKGNTSTYTRYEGDKIDMGTAIFNKGWILETEAVTGMEDTNDALYKAEGTVGKEDITIKYIWHEDNIGPEGGSDKIADKYQIEVSFDVANGTWNDGTNDTINAVLTLVDKDGTPSENGTAVIGIPEAGNAPAEGFAAGSWSANMTDGITKNDQSANFVYTYAEEQTAPADPDNKPGDNTNNNDPDKNNAGNEAETDKDGSAKTGDESYPAMAACLALLAGSAAIGTGMVFSRRKED